MSRDHLAGQRDQLPDLLEARSGFGDLGSYARYLSRCRTAADSGQRAATVAQRNAPHVTGPRRWPTCSESISARPILPPRLGRMGELRSSSSAPVQQRSRRPSSCASVSLLPEPLAAALHYASLERIGPGEIVAVYDFGGGTFDAALPRRTAESFEAIGNPEGIERLGGIDFDEGVFRHVADSLGGLLQELDDSDPTSPAALARVRGEYRLAKEALSEDTDVAIPVMLPNVQTEVRLTRAEFESIVRPRIADTVAALERTVRSAGLTFDDISRVLLVGGTSRIPLIGEMVRDATGRPAAVDAHPKHAIALGAAAHGATLLEAAQGQAAAPIRGGARSRGQRAAPGSAARFHPEPGDKPNRARRNRSGHRAGRGRRRVRVPRGR